MQGEERGESLGRVTERGGERVENGDRRAPGMRLVRVGEAGGADRAFREVAPSQMRVEMP